MSMIVFFFTNFNLKRLSELFPGSGVFGTYNGIQTPLLLYLETWEGSSFHPFPPRHAFGIIVKYKLITKGELDAIFIYDSACKVNVDKEMSLLKGIGGNETPLLFYIACMDTIEMRIHTFNRCAPVSVDWNTKVSNLSYKLQQVLLLQPNRQPDQTAVTSWNDRLLQTIFHRLYVKDKSIYVFKFQTFAALNRVMALFMP